MHTPRERSSELNDKAKLMISITMFKSGMRLPLDRSPGEYEGDGDKDRPIPITAGL